MNPSARPHKKHPKGRRLLERLADVESRDTTFFDLEATEPGPWPIVMRKAKGLRISDADGKRYLDMTACFGVLALGHRHPSALQALRKQMARLIHGMGDVHPSEAKIAFMKTLAQMMPWDDSRIILGLSGGDAMEASIKTAMVATGRHRFIAFAGGYHGLSFGALRLTSRRHFHTDFLPWSEHHVDFVPFPLTQRSDLVCGKPLTTEELMSPSLGEDEVAPEELVLSTIGKHLASKEVAALVVEPLQGRAGERVFGDGFLAKVTQLCREHGTLVIADEIYTGFGRTGHLFGHERAGFMPDLMALGKAIGGGLPLSACVGPKRIMDHWPKSTGEARHTQTFLGHPLSCAVGEATLKALQRNLPLCYDKLPPIDRAFSDFLTRERRARRPEHLSFELRGCGWMRGLWFYRADEGFGTVLARHLLAKGFITLPSGPGGRVLSWTPPLTIGLAETKRFLQAVSGVLDTLS